MDDQVIIYNASRMSEELIIESILDIDKIRPLRIDIDESSREVFEILLNKHYNLKREQVDVSSLMREMYPLFYDLWVPGKLILFDYDIYDGSDPQSNWFFGGFTGTRRGLGYITLSTARLKDYMHARDLIRHELGHMFNAPSDGRTNTYEHLGLHCNNKLCVMQQKNTVPSSIKHAHLRAKKKAETYCKQCIEDIRNYLPRYYN